MMTRTDRKVFVNGTVAMGFTTSFRMGQLLAYRLQAPKRHPETEMMKYMALDFIDAVRQCLKDGGYARVENSVERGGTFLVGVEGHLFRIEDDFQVGEAELAFDAVGCGADVALGALYASNDRGAAPETRIMEALTAAATFSAGVRAPFTVVSISPWERVAP